MLELDDPSWIELEHAYGNAGDLPKQLKKLTTQRGLTDKFWNDLWSSICHQFTIYSASYAAVPHLVFQAAHLNPKQRLKALKLAAGILVCAYEDGKLIGSPPKQLVSDFKKSIQDGRKLVSDVILEQQKSNLDFVELFGIMAAFSGKPDVAGLLWTVGYDFVCPICGDEIINPFEALNCL